MHRLIADSLERLRASAPLVHHITNWVTIDRCADLAKSLGASPVMAHAPEEAADMAGIAQSLVFNIGTLTADLVSAMLAAGRAAAARGTPIVLDVCGAGATPYRDETCRRLLDELPIAVIKGNATEIARVAGLAVSTKGVDSGEVAADKADVCLGLARSRRTVVVMTGAQDIVAAADGRWWIVDNGSELMGRVVGTGCLAATAIGCFAGLGGDAATNAVAGLVCYEVAGELATERSAGPGSFMAALMDAAYGLDAAAVRSRALVACGGRN